MVEIARPSDFSETLEDLSLERDKVEYPKTERLLTEDEVLARDQSRQTIPEENRFITLGQLRELEEAAKASPEAQIVLNTQGKVQKIVKCNTDGDPEKLYERIEREFSVGAPTLPKIEYKL